MKAGHLDVAYKLLERAQAVVPSKYEENVTIELARWAEFCNDIPLAEHTIREALFKPSTSWKLWLFMVRFLYISRTSPAMMIKLNLNVIT